MTTVLFAGGGTGGHIFPNVAIAEGLAAARPDVAIHFLVSNRPGDAQILERVGHPFTPSVVRPLPRRPWAIPGFLLAWRRAVREVRGLIEARDIRAVVATGGFVSGPGIIAAKQAGIARALVNLDAVPGKANRRMRPHASQVFSVFETPALPGATEIGFPLRAASHGLASRAAARAALDLDLAADVPLLFVSGATHGAESIIKMMIGWAEAPDLRGALKDWQVLHQCGAVPPEPLQRAYAAAGIPARVVSTLQGIGNAFRAADLAIVRAGAGTVAEAWANATPTVYLPNPYHADHHQTRNAAPMVALGGAVLLEDRIEVAANLAATVPAIIALLGDPARREQMRASLVASPPTDGAKAIVAWIVDQLR